MVGLVPSHTYIWNIDYSLLKHLRNLCTYLSQLIEALMYALICAANLLAMRDCTYVLYCILHII